MSEVSYEPVMDEMHPPLADELLTDEELQELAGQEAMLPEDWDETAVSWDSATGTCR